MNKIAFVQGRLVSQVENKIQAFPRDEWVKELKLASQNNLKYIELTIDFDRIWENPLSSCIGNNYLIKVLKQYEIEVLACTADFIMHKPPWKDTKENLNFMRLIIEKILTGLSKVSCEIIVIPLVDESSIKDEKEEKKVIEFFLNLKPLLKRHNIKIAFESDYEPLKLKNFISKFPNKYYGINYDVGNSASLGFNIKDEFKAYFERVLHIHIKDRLYKGFTVPLQKGDVDFKLFFQTLKEYNYNFNFSMQTARANKGKDLNTMLEYVDYINSQM